MTAVAEYPIPLNQYQALPLDPKTPQLTSEQRETLKKNIEICRDAIVFFTALQGRIVSGLTGAVKG